MRGSRRVHTTDATPLVRKLDPKGPGKRATTRCNAGK
jgi:hypothetical protein